MKQRRKILVVEDDEDVAKGLGLQLRGNGYEVVVAPDTATAIGKTRSESPDLIVLDLGLPAGDGFVFMDRIRALGMVLTPIVVYSARNPDIDRQRAMDAGAVAFLQKPATMPELLGAIKGAFGEGMPAHAP